MRIVLAKIAGVVGLAAFSFACSPDKGVGTSLPTITSTTLSLKCTATEVTLSVNPPTLIFHGNAGGGNPQNLTWNVDSTSAASDFTITSKDTTGNWPIADKPPYKASKNRSFNGKGKARQLAGVYHYSVSATCNGVVVTFDPDIVVD